MIEFAVSASVIDVGINSFFFLFRTRSAPIEMEKWVKEGKKIQTEVSKCDMI